MELSNSHATRTEIPAAVLCNSLRKRPSYARVVDTLISRSTFGFLESKLATHDLALPLASEIDSRTGIPRATRCLRVLLLSPSDVASPQDVEAALQRIQRFDSLSTEPAVVVFLLDSSDPRAHRKSDFDAEHVEGAIEGVLAYSKLQAELLDHAFPSIPILLLSKLEDLPDLLGKHVTALTQPAVPSSTNGNGNGNATLGLLNVCASAMRNPEAATYLHDTFTSIPDLAEACVNVNAGQHFNSSSPGDLAAFAQQVLTQCDLYDARDEMQTDGHQAKMNQIKHLAGAEQADLLVDFWRTERTIDDNN